MIIKVNCFLYQIALLFIAIAVAPMHISEAQELPIRQKAQEFLVQGLGITTSIIEEKAGVTNDIIGLPYKIVTADSTYDVWVSEDASTVYGYAKKSMFSDENLDGKTVADAISEETAFSAIIPVLSYIGLSINKSDYQMLFSDMGSKDGDEDDLWGCVWRIYKEMKIDGKVCRFRGFNGVIAASSETIYTFRYRPVIYPENTLNDVITYIAARQSAASWLTTQPYFESAVPILSGDENAGIQVIAPEHNMFDNNIPEATDSVKTFYCWEVPFTWTESETEQFEGVVWVNVETGDVIGAAG